MKCLNIKKFSLFMILVNTVDKKSLVSVNNML